MQDIGLADALPLLGLASSRQWEHILDMEVWQRDRMNLDATTSWLALLLKADPARLTQWSAGEKTEFIENYLFHNIDVMIREHDQDPGDFGEGFSTLDNVFYVRIKPDPLTESEDEESRNQANSIRQQVITEYLQHLAAEDHLRYQAILFESVHVLPAEVEERAYRWRNVRMAEKGFLPFEEAVGVYQPLAPEDLESHVAHIKGSESETPAVQQTPLYPAKVMDPTGPFVQSLATLDSMEDRERIQTELATLANRIAVADQARIRSKEDLAQVVRKTCGYLNIGLERLSGVSAQAEKNMAFLRKHPLLDIFRVGYGGALKLKWAAEKWLNRSWFSRQGLALNFWGESGLGVLGGLMLKKPLYFEGVATGDAYREFTGLGDIHKTETALNRIIALDDLLGRLPMDIPKPPSDYLLTCKNLLFTLWSRHYLGREVAIRPIALKYFITFWQDIWEPALPPHGIKTEMKVLFMEWLGEFTGVSSRALQSDYGAIMEEMFAELEAEYGSVAAEDLDPRYVWYFLLKK